MERVTCEEGLDVSLILLLPSVKYLDEDSGLLCQFTTSYKKTNDGVLSDDIISVYTIENKGVCCIKLVAEHYKQTVSPVYLKLSIQDREDSYFGHEVEDFDRIAKLYVLALDVAVHENSSLN